MKTLLPFLTALLLTVTTFAQETASKGYLEAVIDPATGTVSYQKNGEITKDGILLIDMKEDALNKYVERYHPDATQSAIIDKEKQDLDKLRHRILAQRERMMQPMPPMEEVH